tara:strand:- start:1545 stop:2102 length:558 start_codon:yes stop_codon:yes gene_type:complete
MSTPWLIVSDLLALAVLVFVIYFPRNGRRDMVVALLGLNVGLLGIAMTLTRSTVNLGLGLGLFGVLSIIRLRSTELGQQEVAYYFTALALGLLGGMPIEPAWATPSLMGAALVAIYIGDHPKLYARNRNQTVTMDRAHTDESELRERLELMLGGTVVRLKVRRIDLVNDSTVVDVCYKLNGSGQP